MQPADRLHALDAVRAYALLLGVVLHGAAAFLQGFPIPIFVDTPSEVGAPVIYYVIHMFRMSAFFLIAGFFARVLVERRGTLAFVKDRAKRVALPLVLFLVVTGIASAIGVLREPGASTAARTPRRTHSSASVAQNVAWTSGGVMAGHATGRAREAWRSLPPPPAS